MIYKMACKAATVSKTNSANTLSMSVIYENISHAAAMHVNLHSTCSGDSIDLTNGGASREQHDYCCMTIEFQGVWGCSPKKL